MHYALQESPRSFLSVVGMPCLTVLAVIFSLMNFPMTPLTDRDLFSEDVLDSLKLDPVVHESVVILDAAIHTAVQKDYLIRVEKGPT